MDFFLGNMKLIKLESSKHKILILLFPDHLGSVKNSRGSHGGRADDCREADAEEPGRDSEAEETNIKINSQLNEVTEQGHACPCVH